jgi:hypothetical protein
MRPRLLDLFCGAGGAAMGYETALAWAAGFFDGEGYVGVRRDKRPGRNLTLQIGIEQVDPRPLMRFREAVGCPGNVYARPTRRAGNRQIIHRLIMGHRATVQTFQLLWPYLSEPKKEQFLRVAREVDDATAKAT